MHPGDRSAQPTAAGQLRGHLDRAPRTRAQRRGVGTVSYSRLSAKARLQSWLGLLALTASDPDVGWTAATVGRAERGRPQCATLPQLSGDRARDVLADLVRMYEEGLPAPLPLPLKTGERYADGRRRGMDHDKAQDLAATTWTGTKYPGENQDAANMRVWGRDAPFDVLVKTRGNGPNRFAALAGRLWLPLQQHEERGAL